MTLIKAISTVSKFRSSAWLCPLTFKGRNLCAAFWGLRETAQRDAEKWIAVLQEIDPDLQLRESLTEEDLDGVWRVDERV